MLGVNENSRCSFHMPPVSLVNGESFKILFQTNYLGVGTSLGHLSIKNFSDRFSLLIQLVIFKKLLISFNLELGELPKLQEAFEAKFQKYVF